MDTQTPNTQQPENKKKSTAWWWIPRLLTWGLMISIPIGILYLFQEAAKDIPQMRDIERPKKAVSSELYSADGKLLGFIHKGENRVNIDLDQVSPHVINALIVTEDRRFYEHSGIDGEALPKIVWRFIFGEKISGASTITMQLARNLYDKIGKKRNVKRKLKEIIVSALIEKQFTKPEILRSYLNTVNIFGNAYGIQTTSKKLFKKDAKDLKVEEAALIVGMLKGQGVYNPYTQKENTLMRRNTIIGLMADAGHIPKAQKDSLQKTPMLLANDMEDQEIDLAPYLKERVRLWMDEWDDLNGYDVYTDGLKIYTTIDTRMQKHAEDAVRDHMSKLQQTFYGNINGREAWKSDPNMLPRLMKDSERYKRASLAGKSEAEIQADFDKPVKMKVFTWAGEKDTTMSPMDSIKHHAKFLETGMVSIEPQTGKIKSWVGGINYKYFKYDHVDLSKRQCGSTFKPFVYCSAIDNGKGPCERELNQPVYFYNAAGKVTWAPDNAGDEYGGYVTLKKALEYSLNVVTARLVKAMGIHIAIDYAHLLGVESPIEPTPAACLGTADLSVLEMTGAYATFANQGTYIKPYFIQKIEDRDGNPIIEFHPEKRAAINPRTAYVMMEMLRGVVEDHYGTGAGLKPEYGLSGSVGGKTGTTQDQSDGWFMGVTQNLVTGTWVGCAERKMRFSTLAYGQGAKMAMPIFGKFLHQVQNDKACGFPPSSFIKPAGEIPYLDCDFDAPFSDSPGDDWGKNNPKTPANQEPPKKDEQGRNTQGTETGGWD